jgi:YHS domain-containing protein
MARDPVCGKEIDEKAVQQGSGTTRFGAVEVAAEKGTRMFYNGQWFYFCGVECRSKFLAAPQTYLEKPTA